MSFISKLLARLTRRRKFISDPDDPVSVVLLLRDPVFKNRNELQQAAERAWKTSFAGGKDSKHFVIQESKGTRTVTFVKAGPHLLNLLNLSRPYLESEASREFLENIPTDQQRQAWLAHRAWTAIDYVRGGKDFELEYGVLCAVAAELIDENCTGVYIPGEALLWPNDDVLKYKLKAMASARDLGIA